MNVCVGCGLVVQEAYIQRLEESSRIGEGGRGPGSVTFKASTQKASEALKFLPINLHVQEMRVRELPGVTYGPDALWFPRGIVAMEHTLRQWSPLAGRALLGSKAVWNLAAGLTSHATISVKPMTQAESVPYGLSPDSMNHHEACEVSAAVQTWASAWLSASLRRLGVSVCLQHIYDTVTVGAFAAHTMHFKNGGILQLVWRSDVALLASGRRDWLGCDSVADATAGIVARERLSEGRVHADCFWHRGRTHYDGVAQVRGCHLSVSSIPVFPLYCDDIVSLYMVACSCVDATQTWCCKSRCALTSSCARQ